MPKQTILTIDDDPDILDVLELTLSDQFDIIQAPDGKTGLEMMRIKHPDLVICDFTMPRLNGIEFVKIVKKDILLQHIPVVMLTGKGEVKDMVGGIEAGADDYIVKPFEPTTLLARIRMILRQTVRNLDANPLTHLPGNTSIMEELQARIRSKKPFAVGYADLDKFKIYNDNYGFEKGDDVIKRTAELLIKALNHCAGPEAFIGHIGGDDFVIITDDDVMDRTCERIIEEFKKIVPSFYNQTDRQTKSVVGKDRRGNTIKTGLLSISIGIVSSATHTITHVAQIGEIGAELKKYAKSVEQSNFVRDKRKGNK